MAKQSMSLLEQLFKQALDRDPDFMRTAIQKGAQDVMDLEVAAVVGADYHERSEERTNQRNGYRPQN